MLLLVVHPSWCTLNNLMQKLFHDSGASFGDPYETFQTVSVGNSPSCIKTGVFEEHGYGHSLATPCLEAALSSEPTRSVLTSLGLATTCNVSRILMHVVA